MIYIFYGESGAGKDSFVKELSDREILETIISTTSRPMREKEKQGREYNFVSREHFENLIKNNDLIEYRTYNTTVNGKSDTWYYGLPKQDFDKDKNYAVILDMEGMKNFKKAYPNEDIKTVYITTDENIRKQRAIKRGSFDETEWNRRVKDDSIKFSNARNEADYIIENNGYWSDAFHKIEAICINNFIKDYNLMAEYEMALDEAMDKAITSNKLLTNVCKDFLKSMDNFVYDYADIMVLEDNSVIALLSSDTTVGFAEFNEIKLGKLSDKLLEKMKKFDKERGFNKTNKVNVER